MLELRVRELFTFRGHKLHELCIRKICFDWGIKLFNLCCWQVLILWIFFVQFMLFGILCPGIRLPVLLSMPHWQILLFQWRHFLH